MLNSIEEAVSAIKAGEIIVLVDDENRENEGDFICAGKFATPENINFMITNGRGILCVPVEHKVGKRLKLAVPPGKRDPHGTAFSQSLDAIEGTTTGVSAFDRAKSVSEIMRSDSTIEDFYSPGHIYPLLAIEGGVLERRGHTEGVVDLLKLAGLPAVGVLCEVLNADGTMARMPDLEVVCKKHNLKICSIAALADYLSENKINLS